MKNFTAYYDLLVFVDVFDKKRSEQMIDCYDQEHKQFDNLEQLMIYIRNNYSLSEIEDYYTSYFDFTSQYEIVTEPRFIQEDIENAIDFDDGQYESTRFRISKINIGRPSMSYHETKTIEKLLKENCQ